MLEKEIQSPAACYMYENLTLNEHNSDEMTQGQKRWNETGYPDRQFRSENRHINMRQSWCLNKQQ